MFSLHAVRLNCSDATVRINLCNNVFTLRCTFWETFKKNLEIFVLKQRCFNLAEPIKSLRLLNFG
jgi:hypothetical protein